MRKRSQRYEMSMFHFRCPLCGGECPEVSLRTYLSLWGACGKQRVCRLLSQVWGAIRAFQAAEVRWKTRSVSEELNTLAEELGALGRLLALGAENPLRMEDSRVVYSATCPVCSLPAGERKTGRYFGLWPTACKVQVGNLIYEIALVLWAVVRGLPSWASGPELGAINDVRKAMCHTATCGTWLRCPQCGRLTTSLLGTRETAQFCRWCMDAGGGFGICIRLRHGKNGMPRAEEVPKDYLAAGVADRDLIPPELLSD